jgi:hypothetical protein
MALLDGITSRRTQHRLDTRALARGHQVHSEVLSGQSWQNAAHEYRRSTKDPVLKASIQRHRMAVSQDAAPTRHRRSAYMATRSGRWRKELA